MHDELVVECDAADALETARALARIMSGALRLRVPLRVNVSVGRSWGTMSKVDLARAGASHLLSQ